MILLDNAEDLVATKQGRQQEYDHQNDQNGLRFLFYGDHLSKTFSYLYYTPIQMLCKVDKCEE